MIIMVKLNQSGVLIWNLEEERFDDKVPEHINNNDEFLMCPHCLKDNSEITTFLSYSYGIDYDEGKVYVKDFVCDTCLKNINFKDLTEITQNYYNNVFLRDLNVVYNNRVKMIIKNKKGKTIKAGAFKVKVGLNFNSETTTYICGNCKNKNSFNPMTEGIYLCKECGYVNILS